MRFKLLAGRHVNKGKVYTAGDVITTDIDLVKKLGASKFTRIDFESRKRQKAQIVAPSPDVTVRKQELEDEEYEPTEFDEEGVALPKRREKSRRQRQYEREQSDLDVERREIDPVESEHELDDEEIDQESEEDGDDEETPHYDGKPIEEMSVRELIKFANENDISLKGINRKEEMVKAIKSQM